MGLYIGGWCTMLEFFCTNSADMGGKQVESVNMWLEKRGWCTILEFFCTNSTQIPLIWVDNSAQNQLNFYWSDSKAAKLGLRNSS